MLNKKLNQKQNKTTTPLTKNNKEKTSIKYHSKIPMILSICLVILFFILIGTMIFISISQLITTQTSESKRYALGFAISSWIITIPFSIIVYLMIKEIKEYKNIKNQKLSSSTKKEV